jgi:hypothetical protein
MNGANGQPLRRLDEIDEQQVYRFLAEPFQAPQWRAQRAERMEIGASPLDGRVET